MQGKLNLGIITCFSKQLSTSFLSFSCTSGLTARMYEVNEASVEAVS